MLQITMWKWEVGSVVQCHHYLAGAKCISNKTNENLKMAVITINFVITNSSLSKPTSITKHASVLNKSSVFEII